jgi:hypothetical protein
LNNGSLYSYPPNEDDPIDHLQSTELEQLQEPAEAMEGIPTLPTYFELQARALTPANPLKDRKCLFPNSTLQFPRIFFFAK